MAVETLDRLFVQELKDLYSAETQITRALPKLIKGNLIERFAWRIRAHHLEGDRRSCQATGTGI